LIIDPLSWGIATRYEPKPFEEIVLYHAQDASAVLSYVADYRFNTYPIHRLAYTCVSIVKSILGLRRGLLVQTPKALYKYLLTRPGTNVIKPWAPYMSNRGQP
jgi:hypothetical protein